MVRSKPLQIGVTGGIGSGKSMVCQLFACLDIPVYQADSRAKWLSNYHVEVRRQIVELLGPQAYNDQGLYDTTYVASQVFQNETLLKQLNAIIHPAVMRDTNEWVERNATSPYVVKEAAIMNAAGQGNSLDYVVVVDAPVELRVQRILQRDRRTEQEIRAIITRQVSDESRRGIADFVITNDESSRLIPQVLDLHQIFLGKRKVV
ncbi:dephospho-CoA kinase [Dyadobacter luticola]|uniref:Dephospho-CoA kinase n=1 Tax=Dyadobacter luticola TaxID=1979387 RepID=A0A5R9KYC3_9BACT|nr:dephospho-CoA kinase [Dyadobacter luticola]TLV01080.1 dephospho-CoA kinase [Dyadobacter luticola]